ncbi:serine acetyltransferase [Aromatoleum petrolei]|uniref:Serine acetyltransferase n=1 Tax=Aromatoleum petrolei TaxID=76116 RepID=A0ABX1MK25_9RHOO|nr:serine acetyltransferase [Aromatoleum petrolei]NMF86998.1 serine acetyltransferase [Aromatoleum petrolei]QTQ37593.1 putative serine O-acetyltransferase [Aromatoleum petrolei]
MRRDPEWAADLRRYGVSRPFLKEQSIWAVAVYRFGRRVDARREGVAKRLLSAGYWLAFRLVETVVGVSLPKGARIGGGLRIWHFGGVFVHPGAVIGRNCTLRQGVTIGNRREGGPAPVIGDEVEFGAYAQVLGGVRIGNGCRIGALSVVLCDLPDGATAVGAPARIVATRAAPRPATQQEVESVADAELVAEGGR